MKSSRIAPRPAKAKELPHFLSKGGRRRPAPGQAARRRARARARARALSRGKILFLNCSVLRRSAAPIFNVVLPSNYTFPKVDALTLPGGNKTKKTWNIFEMSETFELHLENRICNPERFSLMEKHVFTGIVWRINAVAHANFKIDPCAHGSCPPL